jgi:hypothetical protein
MGRQAIKLMLTMLSTGQVIEGQTLRMPIIIGNSTAVPREGAVDTIAPYI